MPCPETVAMCHQRKECYCEPDHRTYALFHRYLSLPSIETGGTGSPPHPSKSGQHFKKRFETKRKNLMKRFHLRIQP